MEMWLDILLRKNVNGKSKHIRPTIIITSRNLELPLDVIIISKGGLNILKSLYIQVNTQLF